MPATALGQTTRQAESVYLSVAIGDCHTVETFEYGMGGIVDCGSAAGYTVHLVDSDLRQRLILIDDGRELSVDPDVPNFTWLGPLVEFRGYQTPQGFEAHALIVRVHLDDGTGTGTEMQRLLVADLTDDEACTIGWIDAAGNPDHNQDARALAETARTHNCPTGTQQGPAEKS
ncbi:MAG: hypothetical protein RLO50_08675 [Azospirillaceae bacterium]